ncbi:MAG: aromatic ring-hydroxylating dioxygenase subunit alpha [Alphaproteobacteria bacterium]|nr:MAG: aromatic ring-hydroxylating dioxygenase subunit alpha [Alphaproteobacteria bacterium]
MNEERINSLKPGEARSTGPSVQDILDRDGDNPPAPFRDQSYQYLGSDDLTVDRYICPDYAALEAERMWTKVWQMACREEEIPDIGDHIVYDIVDWSFIIVRTGKDDFKAYYNSCLHRGTQLRPSASEGHTENFRCPYHGWTWSLEGELIVQPCDWDFPHTKDRDFSLPQVQLGRWGGFIFINMDDDCEPLEDYLGVLPAQFESWPMEDRFMSANVRRYLPCNWKVAQEAFIESYHVVETHSQALPMTGDANTQYDIWGDNVSRLYTLNGIPSPHEKNPLSDTEIARMLMAGVGQSPIEGDLVLGPGETARSVYTAALKEDLKDKFGADLSRLTTTEVLDPIEYFLFPNFFPWFNFSLPLVYRFRPDGLDPDKCIMDVMLLHPVPDEGPRPEPAPLTVLGPDDSFSKAPELDQISAIFEQDVVNMPMVQKGMKSSRKGITLGNYQEIRLRHMHQTLDAYLAAE